MPLPRKKATTVKSSAKTSRSLDDEVKTAVAKLKKLGNKRTLDGMARYAIPSDNAFGVPVGSIRRYARSLGRDHELALKLWDTGWYEARMLAVFLDDPALVTPAQMDRWCRDFDNWAICDTACFHLFDRTPHAFRKVKQWAGSRAEFIKRAAFALLASLAGHDKAAQDAKFESCLTLIEKAADDNRNFVKKGVSWALRGMGQRNANLHNACVALAQRLAESEDAAARWIGKDAIRDLTRPLVIRRIKSRG